MLLIDGRVVQAAISTNRGSHNVSHLVKLFELQISKIEPALGIELFLLEAPKVEDVDAVQERLWSGHPGLQDTALAGAAGQAGWESRSECDSSLSACGTLLAGAIH